MDVVRKRGGGFTQKNRDFSPDKRGVPAESDWHGVGGKTSNKI